MAKEERKAYSKPLDLFRSPVGKKVLTGLTGLGLTLFVLLHMIGNLGYFSPNPDTYNQYSDFLVGTGPLLYFVEFCLLVIALVHVYIGINIYLGKRRARQVGYHKYRSRGRPSLQSFSSRTMIVTGLVLLVFLVIHLNTFKFGPGVEAGYVAVVGGEEIRDLKRLVTEKFQSPLYTFGYLAVMVLLGFHLRHGVWSALQSIGAMSPKLTPVVYTLGGILAVLIAVGFLVLPLYIYFGV